MVCSHEVPKELVTTYVRIVEGAVAVKGGNANVEVRESEGFTEVWTSAGFGRFGGRSKGIGGATDDGGVDEEVENVIGKGG